MNRDLAKKVADAVLYEGYLLYPYRTSAIKNQQRWIFGILYPPGYLEVARGTERCAMHSECLLESDGDARVEIEVRFLHLVSRRLEHTGDAAAGPEISDDCVERTVKFAVSSAQEPQIVDFRFPGSHGTEAKTDSLPGNVVRTQGEVLGTVAMSWEQVRHGLWKLVAEVSNCTALPPEAADRDAVLLRSLLSAHTVLSATNGEFVSLLEPPENLQEAASSCKNIGVFPVLVGASNEHDMMLCSPILLYDYPQIAPESAGDFYDGTEMDEMLTLRIMTMTDQEKDEMRMSSDHARNLLQRTEASAREQLTRTHGTIRSMRPVSGDRG
jgi:hydrogenase maturation protease